MKIESARFVYAPFKRLPSGHVFIVFKCASGTEIAISPEAYVKQGMTFSLLRGLRKTYPLRYLIEPYQVVLQRYEYEGRPVKEYSLRLSSSQLQELYTRMIQRAEILDHESEWYHTFFNSCITNMLRHFDEVRERRRSWIHYGRCIVVPILVKNI